MAASRPPMPRMSGQTAAGRGGPAARQKIRSRPAGVTWPLGGAFFRERGKRAVPAVSMLIKPASDACDLRCSYCFYADLAEKGGCPSGKRMSEETLAAIIQKHA